MPDQQETTDTRLWAEHEARGGEAFAELLRVFGVAHGLKYLPRPPAEDVEDADRALRECRTRTFDGPLDVAGSVTMLIVRAQCEEGRDFPTAPTPSSKERKRLHLSESDGLLAARTWLSSRQVWSTTWVLDTAATALTAPTQTGPPSAVVVETVQAMVAAIDGGRWEMPRDEAAALRRRLLKLVPAADGGIDTTAIAKIDGWSLAVLPRLVDLADHAAAVNALLQHLVDATGSKPGKAWSTLTRALVGKPGTPDALRAILDSAVDATGLTGTDGYGNLPVYVHPRHVDLVRAAAWAAPYVGDDWVVATLEALTRRGFGIGSHNAAEFGFLTGDKIPNAAVLALGQIATPAALAALQTTLNATSHNGHRKRIAEAIATAASEQGMAASELIERVVPSHDLNDAHQVVLKAGELPCRLTFDDDLRVRVEWLHETTWTKQAPEGAPEGSVPELKRRAKVLQTAAANERSRVEDLLASGRTWTYENWRTYYLEHPLTSLLTERLIWVFDEGKGPISGIPTRDGLRTRDGDRLLPDSGTVRLWHPGEVSTEDVQGWRTWMDRNTFRQPFKQAYREVYLLTPAEQTTGTYSNRFAAHVVHYNQMFALFKQRGWAANYLTPHAGGYLGRARRVFGDSGLTVVFEHLPGDDMRTGRLGAELALTDTVWFHRSSDRTKGAVPLTEVPPLVFSEAMRDVDLFVGVTSIALDPTWVDRGGEPYHDYWAGASLGELTEAAQVRRDALAVILPKLKVAERVHIEGRYVHVRGNLASYKVHIGSANILIEPDDVYLCIVPKTVTSHATMLPFEGDPVLSTVLSKIVLLAADDKIKDDTIVSQLRRRRPSAN